MQNRGPIRKHVHANILLALVQPEIPPNVGAAVRLGACFGVPVHVIEPCGFPFSPRAWRRTAMDYADKAELHRHDSWNHFLAARPPGRLVAMTTKGASSLWEFRFRPGDTLLIGQESAGLPDSVHAAADARLAIPLREGLRSLNMAMAAGIAVAEAARQMADGLPAGFAMRRGREADLPVLQAVERDGTRAYAAVGYDFVVGASVRDTAEHLRGIDSGALFVVEGPDGAPSAFALAWIVDGRAHLAELSVVLAHQRRGLGLALVAAVGDWAQAGRFDEITLTAFRDVPWNAPLYARLGWEVFAPGPDRPGLRAIIADEAAHGYARRPRVAMRKRLG